MTGEELLASMHRVYTGCETYRDEGRILTRYLYPQGARGRPDSVQLFKTAFARPNRFRLDTWHEHPSGQAFRRAVAWGNGEEVRHWQQSGSIEGQPGALRDALILTLGVAARQALSVFALLIPERLEGWWLDCLVDLAPVVEETIGAAPCYRTEGWCTLWGEKPSPEALGVIEEMSGRFTQLTGKDPRPSESLHLPVRLWVDQSSFLLRRLSARQVQAQYQSETSVTYAAAVNCVIPESDLCVPPD